MARTIATTDHVGRDALLEFVRHRHHVVLVTRRRGGSPQLSPVTAGYFRVIAGEHDDWDAYRRAMVEQGKCLLRVTIDRWGPIATGGFPPRLADGPTPGGDR